MTLQGQEYTRSGSRSGSIDKRSIEKSILEEGASISNCRNEKKKSQPRRFRSTILVLRDLQKKDIRKIRRQSSLNLGDDIFNKLGMKIMATASKIDEESFKISNRMKKHMTAIK